MDREKRISLSVPMVPPGCHGLPHGDPGAEQVGGDLGRFEVVAFAALPLSGAASDHVKPLSVERENRIYLVVSYPSVVHAAIQLPAESVAIWGMRSEKKSESRGVRRRRRFPADNRTAVEHLAGFEGFETVRGGCGGGAADGSPGTC